MNSADVKMASWRWDNRPPLSCLASPTKPLVQQLRKMFAEALYQLYTPKGTPEDLKVFYVTSNADDSPYEAWITSTMIRNYPDILLQMLETRLHDPETPVCREIVRDDVVNALDVAGVGSPMRLETYTLENFPETCSGSKEVARETKF